MKLCRSRMLAFRQWTLFSARRSEPASQMRPIPAITFLTLFVAAFAAGAAPLPAPHQVDIPLENGILHAQLYKPEGNGPFPVVIALHGCGGVSGHFEPGQVPYRDWAEELVKDGKA